MKREPLLGPANPFNVLGWLAVAVGFGLLALMAFCSAGCADDTDQQRDDWVAEQPYVGFSSGPQCPAPSSPHAAAYQESGGSSNAWLWWMALHAVTTDHGYYEPAEVHHHYYARPRPDTRVAAQRFTPPGRIETNLGVKPVTAIRPVPVQSRSYGYKPSRTQPASIKFKPSVYAPVRSATPRTRTR